METCEKRMKKLEKNPHKMGGGYLLSSDIDSLSITETPGKNLLTRFGKEGTITMFFVVPPESIVIKRSVSTVLFSFALAFSLAKLA